VERRKSQPHTCVPTIRRTSIRLPCLVSAAGPVWIVACNGVAETVWQAWVGARTADRNGTAIAWDVVAGYLSVWIITSWSRGDSNEQSGNWPNQHRELHSNRMERRYVQCAMEGKVDCKWRTTSVSTAGGGNNFCFCRRIAVPSRCFCRCFRSLDRCHAGRGGAARGVTGQPNLPSVRNLFRGLKEYHDGIVAITSETPEVYGPTGQSRTEAIWRTIIGDRTIIGLNNQIIRGELFYPRRFSRASRRYCPLRCLVPMAANGEGKGLTHKWWQSGGVQYHIGQYKKQGQVCYHDQVSWWHCHLEPGAEIRFVWCQVYQSQWSLHHIYLGPSSHSPKCGPLWARMNLGTSTCESKSKCAAKISLQSLMRSLRPSPLSTTLFVRRTIQEKKGKQST